MHISSRRRLAALAVFVTLTTTACGAAESTSSTSPNADLARITVAAAPGGLAESSKRAANDMMFLAAPMRYTFAGADADPASAAVWRFVKPTIAVEQVERLAHLLGVAGPAVVVPAGEGGGFLVGPADYSGPTLRVMDDALGSWWYSAGVTGTACISVATLDEPTPIESTDTPTLSADGTVQSDAALAAGEESAAQPGSSSTVETGSYAPCEVRVNDTAASVADSLLDEVLAELGVDPDTVATTSIVEQWATTATAEHRFGGVASSMTTSVSFFDGDVTWASGFLASAEKVDAYPLLGYNAALDRFNESWGMPLMSRSDSPTEVLSPDVPMKEGSAVADSSSAEQVTGEAVPGVASPDDAVMGRAPIDPALVAPAPDAPAPLDPAAPPVARCGPPEIPYEQLDPEVIEVVSPVDVLVQVWDADGAVWLVPGYRFMIAGTTGTIDVVALGDEYLGVADGQGAAAGDSYSDTAVVETEVVETGVVDTAGSSTAPLEPTPAEMSAGGSASGCLEVPAEADTRELEELASGWAGLSEADATAAAEAAGAALRVVSLDGEDMIVTADYSSSRVNVAVVDGTVTAIASIG